MKGEKFMSPLLTHPRGEAGNRTAQNFPILLFPVASAQSPVRNSFGSRIATKAYGGMHFVKAANLVSL